MHYHRLYTNGATFFTLVTYQRRKIFTNPNGIQLLRSSISIVKNKYPFEINAIVVLPEHLHCLLTLPDNDYNFSLRLRLIKAEFSRKHEPLPCISFDPSRHAKQEKHIWQRRFLGTSNS